MAELVKKNAPIAKWDPIRAMREMFSWDPFREMAPFAPLPNIEPVVFAPSFEVVENAEAFLFKADVPGIKKEDLEINVVGNRLQISGKREAEHEIKNETVYAYERQYGSFCRSFTLPEGVDLEHAKSELKDGVLTLAVPKKPGAFARKIAISTAAKS